MKKAQGISINTIIVASIALVVLLILIAVFTGRIGDWGLGVDRQLEGTACENPDLERTWRAQCDEGETQAIGIFNDAEGHEGEVCCRRLPDS